MSESERRRILFVTSNVHKAREANLVLERFGLSVEPISVEKLEPQLSSLIEISKYSALHAYDALRKPLLCEDAGLFIRSLKGFPGPYSSFVFKTIGVHGILKLMEGNSDRTAYFESAVAYVDSKGVRVFSARVYGTISHQARGEGGFGFDPIFIPLGRSKTFAEMSMEEKCQISHRAKSFALFARWYLRKFSRG